jgi:hypothetical protein
LRRIMTIMPMTTANMIATQGERFFSITQPP